MNEIKKKICQSCGESFVPFRTFDKVCSYKCSVNLKTKEGSKQSKSVIKRISVKRKSQNTAYLLIRNEFLKNNPTCKVCKQKSTEIHHMNGRSNERLVDTAYFLPVCRSCHRWIHDNPSEARDRGYLI